MGRPVGLAPEVELEMAKANLELARLGRPPKYDLSPPDDQQISQPMGSYLWNWMHMWGQMTNGSMAAIERIQAERHRRRAEDDRRRAEIRESFRRFEPPGTRWPFW